MDNEMRPEWIPTEEQRAAGITETDLMREYPPAEPESNDPEEYWPVDEYGLKIPMDEWTVEDLVLFPDSMKGWLLKEMLKATKGKETELVSILKDNPNLSEIKSLYGL